MDETALRCGRWFGSLPTPMEALNQAPVNASAAARDVASGSTCQPILTVPGPGA